MGIPATCVSPGCDHEEPCPVHPRTPPVDHRPNSYRRGYGGKGWHRARTKVLRRDPLCTDPSGCDAPSVVADHHPRSRRELLADPTVTDPDAPELMRGLCKPHHDAHTGRTRR